MFLGEFSNKLRIDKGIRANVCRNDIYSYTKGQIKYTYVPPLDEEKQLVYTLLDKMIIGSMRRPAAAY